MQRFFKDLMVLGLAGVSVIYLINPTAGFIEFLPDNLPLVGNLDEATATLIFLSALRYYGLDVSRFFGRGEADTAQPPHDQVHRPDSRR